MPKYFDGMGREVSDYVWALEANQEDLKAKDTEIAILKAEVKRLKARKLKEETE